jgi:hypothetical protein
MEILILLAHLTYSENTQEAATFDRESGFNGNRPYCTCCRYVNAETLQIS